MALKRIFIFLIAVTMFGCGRNAVDPLQESYRALRAVPRERWQRLAQKNIFFGHQSVGQNIIEGLGLVMKAEPSIGLNIEETADPAAFSGPIFAHFPIGHNRDPKGKIDDFRRLLESGIGRVADIAFFKFCFVDVDRKTDIGELLDHYERTIADLTAEFPQLTVIAVTVPLTNHSPGIKARIKRLLGRGPAVKEDNVQRNLANTRIRQKYGTAVWDLSKAEAVTDTERQVSFSDGRNAHPLLNPAYSKDGGHLNAVGSQAVACSLLVYLASLCSR